ncbi:MAG: pilin [Patescibacteria group bacterium]
MNMLLAKNKHLFIRFLTAPIFLIILNFIPKSAQAEGEKQYVKNIGYLLEVPIPTISSGGVSLVNNIVEYVQLIYEVSISIIAPLAVVAIIYGGVRIASSAGNEQSITSGKQVIISAIIGLLIPLLSYSGLKLINSQLVDLQNIQVEKIVYEPDTEPIYTLPDCGRDSRFEDCKDTLCGETCFNEELGLSCRGEKANSANATASCSGNMTVIGSGPGQCECYPYATSITEGKIKYKMQSADCVDPAIIAVQTYDKLYKDRKDREFMVNAMTALSICGNNFEPFYKQSDIMAIDEYVDLVFGWSHMELMNNMLNRNMAASTLFYITLNKSWHSQTNHVYSDLFGFCAQRNNYVFKSHSQLETTTNCEFNLNCGIHPSYNDASDIFGLFCMPNDWSQLLLNGHEYKAKDMSSFNASQFKKALFWGEYLVGKYYNGTATSYDNEFIMTQEIANKLDNNQYESFH